MDERGFVAAVDHFFGRAGLEADLHALARLLSGFGVWLSASQDGGPPQPLAGSPAPGAAPASASLVLSDGRSLHIAGPAATPAPASEPTAVLQERRAGPEAADMRFRLPLIAVIGAIAYGEAIDPFVLGGGVVIFLGIWISIRAELQERRISA